MGRSPQIKRGPRSIKSESDAAPTKPLRYLTLMGVTSITYYLSGWSGLIGPAPMIATVLKFVCYVSIILWLNSAFYLSKYAAGVEVECFEFQREQVKFTLWITLIWVVRELPLILSSVGLSRVL